MEVWTAPGWNQEFTKTSTLKAVSNGVFTGVINYPQYTHLYLMLGDKKYAPNDNFDKDINDVPLFYNNGWGRVIFNQEITYTIKATISPDNSTIKVEFIEPTPLILSINDSPLEILSDITSYTGTVKYNKSIAVRNTPVCINGFSIGSTTYGAASKIDFTDSSEAQTCTMNLTTGGQPINLTKNGNYAISVMLNDGVPQQITINKSEMVPDLSINNQFANYENGFYTATVTLAKNSLLTLKYNDTQYYYIQSDIDGSLENPTGQVYIATSNRGAKILTRGSYNISIDLKSMKLTYTNTTPPQPSTLSPPSRKDWLTANLLHPIPLTNQ